MAEYLIQDTTLTAIADEVRTLSDVTDELSPSAMTVNVRNANSEISTQTELLAQVVSALVGKAAGNGGALPDGVSAIASGTFTPSTDITNEKTIKISHGLGVAPNFIYVFPLNEYSLSNDNAGETFIYAYLAKQIDMPDINMRFYGMDLNCYVAKDGTTMNMSSGTYMNSNDTTYIDDFPIRGASTTGGWFKAGHTYRWIAGVADDLN